MNVKPQRIARIGHDQQENLALQYLAAAAERAGHHADLVAFNSLRDLERCVSTVLSSDYDLVGMTIALQYAVQDHFGLARALCQLEY